MALTACLCLSSGVVALSFQLPIIGKGGWWRIRVSVRGQIEEKFMRMTKMRTQQWEVGTQQWEVDTQQWEIGTQQWG